MSKLPILLYRSQSQQAAGKASSEMTLTFFRVTTEGGIYTDQAIKLCLCLLPDHFLSLTGDKAESVQCTAAVWLWWIPKATHQKELGNLHLWFSQNLVREYCNEMMFSVLTFSDIEQQLIFLSGRDEWGIEPRLGRCLTSP